MWVNGGSCRGTSTGGQVGHPSFYRVGEAFTALVVGGPIAGLRGLWALWKVIYCG